MTREYSLITPVEIPEHHPKIKYRHPVFMAGSCFTEHIADKLDRYKYDVVSNPFGILYNPVSLAKSVERIADLNFYSSNELVRHEGLYHSMDHHGSYSTKDKGEVLEKINQAIQIAHDHLKKSGFICISPGTANVYRYHETSAIVGNCHKIPQTNFVYESLTTTQCEEAFQRIFHSIKKINTDAQLIWTVSPVRHIKDGLIENQRSKAKLILSLSQALAPQGGTSYFPAYEIMVDELRDYRFYARDLTHPSELAVDIIWERFCSTYLDPGEMEIHPQIEKIRQAIGHRMLHNDLEAIRSFATRQLKNIDQLAMAYPDMNWQRERQHFFQYLEKD